MMQELLNIVSLSHQFDTNKAKTFFNVFAFFIFGYI